MRSLLLLSALCAAVTLLSGAYATTPTISILATVSGPQGPLQRAIENAAMETAEGAEVNITIVTRFSGPAQDAFIAGESDFSTADIPLENVRLRIAGRPIVQFPIYTGAVQFHQSIPGLRKPLRLRACTLAGIYSGLITTWDHPEIVKTNKGLKVPRNQRIVAIARNDFSNFTTLVTEYFEKACPQRWNLPVAENINWPAGILAVPGNALLPTLANNSYGIAYLDLTSTLMLPPALKNSAVEIENPAGKFVSAGTGVFKTAGFSYDEDELPGPTQSWEKISLVWEELPGKRHYDDKKRHYYDSYSRVPSCASKQYPIAFLAFFFADADMTARGAEGVIIKEYGLLQLSPTVQNDDFLRSFGWRLLPRAFRLTALEAATSIKVEQPVRLPGVYARS